MLARKEHTCLLIICFTGDFVWKEDPQIQLNRGVFYRRFGVNGELYLSRKHTSTGGYVKRLLV